MTPSLSAKKGSMICEAIKERGLKNYWGCTARVDTISEDLLKTMKDAGCITMFLGVESADQQVLNEVNKKTNIAKIKETFELTRKYDMKTIASVVLGMPGDTKSSIRNTINFVKQLEPSYAVFSLATPYPGTDFYIKAASENLIKINDWSKYTLLSPVLETVDCSLEELRKLQKKAFTEFYLRPRYILRQTRMDGPIILKTIASIVRGV